MRISDLENQSMVGTVMVLEAIAIEVLTGYLKRLSPDDRKAAMERMTADVLANAKQVVDMAPKAQLANAQKIQAAATRIMAAAAAEALATVK